MKDRYSYYLLLLGGTGARCGEIFIHMCANGYFGEKEVNLLYIDSDMDNGNAKSMREAEELYEKCREAYLIKESPIPGFFKTEIHLKEVNPVSGIERFKQLAEVNQTDGESLRSAKMLMRALYSDEECEMKISDGFFARPNVGAAVFAANMDKILADLLIKINKDLQELKKIKIFMIGSVFGGTGASSFPTISRYLKQKLFGESTDKLIGDKLAIGGGMLLPYFSFTRDKSSLNTRQDDIEIEANKFSTKTKTAIEYYKEVEKNSGTKIFDTLYILGHDGYDVRGVYETAGSKQKNLPHIVEFYTAMSAVAFFDKNPIHNTGKYFVVVPSDHITWNNMHEMERCFFSFLVMMRFSLVMKSLIMEELFERGDGQLKMRSRAREIPWYYDFIDGRSESEDLSLGGLPSKFSNISKYCSKYITWFSELIISDPAKRGVPDTLNLKTHGKSVYAKEEDDDMVEYLNLFNNELMLKQFMNILIEDGLPGAYTQEKREGLYKENIEYIRKNASALTDISLFTENNLDNITFEDIWSRLNSFGFNSFVRTDHVFKNIENSAVKTMDEGVRNLINAIYIACMI